MVTPQSILKFFPLREPRANQLEVIARIINAFEEKKIVILEAPTGIGKSVIGITIGRYYKDKLGERGRTYILTSQKDLQDQYITDFGDDPDYSVTEVKGASNYTCDRDRALTCDIGVCKSPDFINKCMCEYAIRRNVTYTSSDCSILNYSYFLNVGREIGTALQTKRKLLICDETHNIESEITGWASVSLNESLYNKYDISTPDIPVNINDNEFIYEWFKHAELPRLTTILIKVNSDIEDCEKLSSRRLKLLKKKKFLDDIINISQRLFESTDIVLSRDTDGFTLKPLYAKGFTKPYLFSFADKILLMSATILNRKIFCENIGIDKEEIEFISLDSPFNINHRPILDCSIGAFSYNNLYTYKDQIIDRVNTILNLHSGQPGIIHTQSYKLAQMIVDGCNNSRILFPHGKDKNKIIKTFIDNPHKNYVIISPSMKEGYDLKDNVCRFSIIAKAPYAALGDQYIKIRANLSPSWYKNEAVKDLIQMTGRPIRNVNDWAITYILDKNCIKLINESSDVPAWWKDSLTHISEFNFDIFSKIVQNLEN